MPFEERGFPAGVDDDEEVPAGVPFEERGFPAGVDEDVPAGVPFGVFLQE